MAQQICENDIDVEYKKAVREFYQIYNSLRKKRALRMNSHDDGKGSLIEIREYTNDGKIKMICRVKAENSTECHRMATEYLKRE